MIHIRHYAPFFSFAFAGTRSPEEVVAKVKTFRAQDASGLMSTVKTEISAKPAAAASAPASGRDDAASSSTKSSPALTAALAPDAAASALPEEDDWTSSEQKALEVLTGRQRVAAVLSLLCSWH
jgi:hypothetical protein